MDLINSTGKIKILTFSSFTTLLAPPAVLNFWKRAPACENSLRDDGKSHQDEGRSLSDNGISFSDNSRNLPDDRKSHPAASISLSDEGKYGKDDGKSSSTNGRTLQDGGKNPIPVVSIQVLNAGILSFHIQEA